MIKISKAGAGTVDYLANAELAHNSISDLAFDTERLQKHLAEQGIKPEQMDFKVYENYLNQESSHYKAKLSGGLSDLWELEYSKQLFSDLKSGKSPIDSKEFEEIHGYKLKKSQNLINIKENQQTGLSMLSTVPKSVSIHFARGPQEQRDKIHSALVKANEMMYEEYAKQLKPSCKKGEYQDFDPKQTKWLVMSFTHYEDRGLDPHLHIHDEGVAFAEFALYKHDKDGNRIKDEKGNFVFEKKMLAIDPEDVFKRQLENSAMHDCLLNAQLQKAGFKTEPMLTEDNFETFRISGYTREQELSMSKRQAEIESFIEEQKAKGNYFSSGVQAEAAFAESIRRNTQDQKTLHNSNEILQIVKNEVDKNISLEEQKKIDLIQKTKAQEYKINVDYKKILTTAGFETEGIIDETKLRKAIIQEIKYSRNFESVQDLNIAVDKTIETLSMGNEFDRLIKTDNGQYTRLDVVFNEKALLINVNAIKRNSSNLSLEQKDKFQSQLDGFVEQARQAEKPLKDGQREACENIIKNKPITLVIGDAGTGKTSSVIKFANQFHSENGKKVFGISTQTKTTKALTDANIKDENCLNTKQFITKAFDEDGIIKPNFLAENKNSVLIFDEAGMIGAEDFRKITTWARQSNSQLILVGDHKQLQSVSYGNAFVQIQQQLDKSDISRLWENTRQKNEIAKDIAEGYRDKDIDKVFNALEKGNCLVTDKDTNKLTDKLCADYLADNEQSKIIVCGLNSEIDYINDKIRNTLINNGNSGLDYKNQVSIEVERKSNQTTIKSERSFCKGDRIVFLENFKDKKQRGSNLFNNADQGIIKNIEPAKNGHYLIEVEISTKDGLKSVEFNTGEYNKFNHCFAISSHKSQGATVKNTYHLGNPNTSAQKAYVDGSRHEEKYKLYINENDIEKYKQKAVKEAVKATTLEDKNCQKAFNEFRQEKLQEQAELNEIQLRQEKYQAENMERAKQQDARRLEEEKLKEKEAQELAKKLEQERLEKEQQTKAFAEKQAQELKQAKIINSQTEDKLSNTKTLASIGKISQIAKLFEMQTEKQIALAQKHTPLILKQH